MKRNHGCLTTKGWGRRIDLAKAASRVALGSFALLLGLAAGGTPTGAAATPVCGSSILLPFTATVYLFTSANTAVAMPSATILEGGIYTDGVLLGVLDANDNIVDAEADIIGYVLYTTHD